MSDQLRSPLLDADSGILDARQRKVIAGVVAAERIQILDLPTDDPLDAKRHARVVATGPELRAQPDAVIASVQHNDDVLDAVAKRLSTGMRRIVLVGAGDSLAVMVGVRQAFEQMAGVPAEPVQSLEFAYYQAELVDDSTAVLLLSSSGETARTVEALMVAQAAGAYTVALTNTPGSTLAREASEVVSVLATRVGWPTQSSSAAMALLLELAVRIGASRGVETAAALREALAAVPDQMRDSLPALDTALSTAAEREAASPTVLFSGAGPCLAAAIVGAAKVKECTPLRASEIQLEEFHHYNSLKAGEALMLLVPSGPGIPRAVETATDVHRWKGRLYVVTTEGETAFDGLDPEGLIHLPAVPECLSALLYLLPAQLLGYHLGLAGHRAAVAAAAPEPGRSGKIDRA